MVNREAFQAQSNTAVETPAVAMQEKHTARGLFHRLVSIVRNALVEHLGQHIYARLEGLDLVLEALDVHKYFCVVVIHAGRRRAAHHAYEKDHQEEPQQDQDHGMALFHLAFRSCTLGEAVAAQGEAGLELLEPTIKFVDEWLLRFHNSAASGDTPRAVANDMIHFAGSLIGSISIWWVLAGSGFGKNFGSSPSNWWVDQNS